VNHTVRVVALGQGQIFHVGVEVEAASQTVMLGIGDLDVPRPTGDGITQVVQPANDRAQAISTSPTLRASPTREAAPTLPHLRFGQILNTRNSFGHIANIPSWPSHGDILHESLELSAEAAPDQKENSVMMLQCHKML
jgi:hypothetical protein